MAKPKLDKELIIHTPNRIGVLAEVCTALSNSRVNIEAMCAYGVGEEGTFYLYTFDQDKAKKAIEEAGFEVELHDVLVVMIANRVGAAEGMTNRVAKTRVNVDYCYGSAGDGKHTLFIMSTTNNDKALKSIRNYM